MSLLALLTSISLSLALFTLLLFLGMLVVEARERWRARRWRWLAARYQESVALLVAGELAPERMLQLVRPRDRRAVTHLLLDYAVHVQLAAEQAMLVTVFRGLGAVRHALRESRSWRWWIRAGATRRLGQMRDPESLERLHGLLQDGDPEVRTAALWAIIQLGGDLPVAVLIQSVTGGRLVSSLRVAALLLEAGHQVVPALRAFLASPPSRVAQAQAILLAGELHALDVEPAILAALNSPASTVRVAACRALGKLESLGAFAGLAGALQDPEWTVQAAAAEALGRMGDAAAVPALTPLLAQTNPSLLLAVCRALGALGAEGVAALQERQRALAVTGAMGESSAAPDFAHAVQGDSTRGHVIGQVLAEVLAEVGP